MVLSKTSIPIQGLISRKAAWEVIQSVGGGAFSDVALDRILKNYSFNSLDRALITELSYGAIRQRYYLDCWVDFLGKVPATKQPPLLRWLLHLGLYQILKMERIPPAAAINTTVELAKTKKLSKLAPVVNGILRGALRARASGDGLPLPESFAARLAQEESFPIWLIDQLISWEGVNVAQNVVKASNQVPPIDLRVLQAPPKINNILIITDLKVIQTIYRQFYLINLHDLVILFLYL